MLTFGTARRGGRPRSRRRSFTCGGTDDVLGTEEVGVGDGRDDGRERIVKVYVRTLSACTCNGEGVPFGVRRERYALPSMVIIS
jgi:hypothetical protein